MALKHKNSVDGGIVSGAHNIFCDAQRKRVSVAQTEVHGGFRAVSRRPVEKRSVGAAG